MIIKKNLSKMNTNYHLAFEYLESKFIKEERNYRIIDIGGAQNPWAGDWLTHVVDKFVEPKDISKINSEKIEVFKIDIDDTKEWEIILNEVEKNGKFDFVICTHTLEDINNPQVACRMINQIGKAGFISMPSKYAELTVFEYKYNLPYCGYHHHRWIYQIKNNILVGFPKMNFHDYVEFVFDKNAAVHSEIAFLWENNFNYEMIYPDQMMDNRSGDNKISELFEDDDLVLK
jgi:hypothetical protein